MHWSRRQDRIGCYQQPLLGSFVWILNGPWVVRNMQIQFVQDGDLKMLSKFTISTESHALYATRMCRSKMLLWFDFLLFQVSRTLVEKLIRVLLILFNMNDERASHNVCCQMADACKAYICASTLYVLEETVVVCLQIDVKETNMLRFTHQSCVVTMPHTHTPNDARAHSGYFHMHANIICTNKCN